MSTGLDLQEQTARIDRELATHDRLRQGITMAPWLAIIAGMWTGAAFFAAGVALVKVLG